MLWPRVDKTYRAKHLVPGIIPGVMTDSSTLLTYVLYSSHKKKPSFQPRQQKRCFGLSARFRKVYYNSPFLGQLNTPEETKDTAILLKGWCNY
jgi:hypothetical protein